MGDARPDARQPRPQLDARQRLLLKAKFLEAARGARERDAAEARARDDARVAHVAAAQTPAPTPEEHAAAAAARREEARRAAAKEREHAEAVLGKGKAAGEGRLEMRLVGLLSPEERAQPPPGWRTLRVAWATRDSTLARLTEYHLRAALRRRGLDPAAVDGLGPLATDDAARLRALGAAVAEEEALYAASQRRAGYLARAARALGAHADGTTGAVCESPERDAPRAAAAAAEAEEEGRAARARVDVAVVRCPTQRAALAAALEHRRRFGLPWSPFPTPRTAAVVNPRATEYAPPPGELDESTSDDERSQPPTPVPLVDPTASPAALAPAVSDRAAAGAAAGEDRTPPPPPPPKRPRRDVADDAVREAVKAFVRKTFDPYYAAHVISKEVCRGLVRKVTDKVCAHHADKTDAGFLPLEGDKIQKLCKQYLKRAGVS